MSEIKGRLVSAFYKTEKGKPPLIYMAIRTNNGKKIFPEPIRSPIRPYFYFDEKDREVIKQELEMMNLVEGRDYEFHTTNLEFALQDGKPMRCDLWEPWRVGQLRKHFQQMGVELSEADIPFIRRIRIDGGIKAGLILKNNKISAYNGKLPPPKLVFLDIETDDSRGFPEEAGQYSILCASATTDDGEIHYFTWEYGKTSESKMLQNLFDFLMDYDYIVVWNKDFEQKQLSKRCKALGLWLEWRIWRFVDLAEFHRIFHQKTYYDKLTTAYEKMLKKYETKLIKNGIKIRDRRIRHLPSYYKAWKNNPQKMKDINISHSYALYVMEKAMDIINLYSSVADEVGIFIDFAVWSSHIVDTSALRLLTEEGKKWVVPSTRKYEEKKKSFKGAIVFPPKRGIHSFMFVYDFLSLYNRIIQSYLLDPIAYYKWNGTFTENGIEEYMKFARAFGEFYGKEGLPLFPSILHKLEGRRNELKEEMKKYSHNSAEYEEYYRKQYSVKVILLAHYGVLGMSSSRWKVEKEIPENMMLHIKDNEEEVDFRIPDQPREKFVGMVTYLARTALLKTKSFFEGEKNVLVVYGDSDSVVIKSPNLINVNKTYKNLTRDDMKKLLDFGNNYSKKLEEFYKDKFESGIEIKLEKIIDRGVFGKVKKQYFWRVIYDDNNGWQRDENSNLSWYPYSRGLPLVRSDRTQFLRKFQMKTLNMILDSPEKLDEMWSKIIKDYYDNKYDHMLILKIGIKKRLDEYEKETPVIQAAKKLVARGGKIRPGEKMAYIVIDVDKNKKIAEPIDENLTPEEAVKKLPKLTKRALDFYWKNRIWNNVEPFLRLVLNDKEINKIKLIKERKISMDQFL